MTDSSKTVRDSAKQINEQLDEIVAAIKDGRTIEVPKFDLDNLPPSTPDLRAIKIETWPNPLLGKPRKVIVHQTKSGRWHWRLLAARGSRVDARSGDGFSREDSARRGVTRQYPHLQLDIEVRR